MHRVFHCLTMTALLGLPAVASAQSPPNALMAGEVQQNIVSLSYGAICYVNRGFSSFQRNGAASEALISFDEIAEASRDLKGQAIMTFNDATSGSIRFKMTAKYPSGIVNPPFVNYSQSFSQRQLTVRFTINFNDCVLPILAVYDAT
jgi:hypothetical protein